MNHPTDYTRWRALLRRDLSAFIARAFVTVNPGTPFLPNWHIDLIAEHLTACTHGKISRLIINMPPRALKSLCVSVAWPAWLMGHDPSTRIIVSSYARALSIKHSQDCRLVLQAPWYAQVFPKTRLSGEQKDKTKFITTKRGFRLATATGASITGEGGNFLIVDDPHNAIHASSPVMRQRALDWFEQAFISRLDDKKKGVIVVVMQRLHEDDLTGHLLKAGHWHHLCLPAIAEEEASLTFGNITVTRAPGDLLHPDRENHMSLEKIRQELGSYHFAAQYQQNPVPKEGGIIQKSWLRYYEEAPSSEQIIQSWDTAIKAEQHNDYSVCSTWIMTDNSYYLIDILRRRMEYPDLKRAVLAWAERYQPQAILIEDKASGQSLLQELRQETSLPVVPVKVSTDKLLRVAQISGLFESGKVLLPKYAPWLAEYERELLSFPAGKHDDQADATSQFLNWVRRRRMPGIRGL